MDPYSEQVHEAAYSVRWQAERLAGVHAPRRRSPLSVPAEWTACLLMDKAGVPQPLIATVSAADPQRLGRHLMVVKALMMFPHYAARIEALMRNMPRFGANETPSLKPAREAACAVQAG
jgi:hypothetical protein